MTRPRLLDLFCGSGGCSVGYARAGFYVYGVDIEPHRDYPFRFVRADAMDVLAGGVLDLDWFDVIHASPPCPRYSTATPADRRDTHPDLVPPVLAALREWRSRTGGEWVVENVPGAPLPDPVTLCGPSLGLRGIKRHRLFASSALILSPGCACDGSEPFGIYGDHGQRQDAEHRRPDGTRRGRKAYSAEHARELLGAPWVKSWDDLTDLIPPAYTELVGACVMDALREHA